MNIFEELENLNVSEECFNDIMDIVEEIINEVSVNKWRESAKNSTPLRAEKVKENPENKENEVRLKRAKDIVSNFKNSKKSANRLVKGSEKVINHRDYENMYDDIYATGDERDFKKRLKKAELALSANKNKYHKYRDQERSEDNPYTPWDSPHYDERKGMYNQK